jgi:ArsR family transcriptional regulator
MDIAKISKRLEALGNPTRLAAYRLLVRAGEGGLAVGDLQDRLDIPASTLSHHLHKLIAVGLVDQERRSTTLICRANYGAMQETLGFLVDECCADACATAEIRDTAEAL